MKPKQKAGLIVAVIGLLIDVVNMVPTVRSAADAFITGGGGGAVAVRFVLDPRTGITMVVIGLVAMFMDRLRAGIQSTWAPTAAAAPAMSNAVVQAPVINQSPQINVSPVINVGQPGPAPAPAAPAPPPPASDVQHPPPAISVHVTSGSSARIFVTNHGGPFKLVARAKIVSAPEPIDHGGSYIFYARNVLGGNDESGYIIAEISDGHLYVNVVGEGYDSIQKWEGWEGFQFDTEWIFLQKDGSYQKTLAVVVVRATVERDPNRLSVKIIDPGKNEGQMTVNIGR